jgi:hypothetical protein
LNAAPLVVLELSRATWMVAISAAFLDRISYYSITRRTISLNLTYDDLAERLGITRNAARVLAQRRK